MRRDEKSRDDRIRGENIREEQNRYVKIRNDKTHIREDAKKTNTRSESKIN